jgi:hypothetical protein
MRKLRIADWGLWIGMASLAGGCTSESTRLALENQRRANEVDQAIFERQSDGLKVLLFRDARERLANAPSPEERDAVLNAVWNERDLIEFWAVQHERAGALRLIGVDAKLYADQSAIDLLLKQIEAKGDRAKEGIVEAAGKGVGN